MRLNILMFVASALNYAIWYPTGSQWQLWLGGLTTGIAVMGTAAHLDAINRSA